MGNSYLASLETLIVLDYLITQTNKEKLTRRKDIVEYANKKYGYPMDNRKATNTLEYIYKATTSYPNFPYKIEKVSTRSKSKYWGKYKTFDKKSLKRLLIAIFNSPFLSTKGEYRIAESLCSSIVDEGTYNEAIEELKNRHLRENFFGNFQNTAYYNLLRDIEDAKQDGLLLTIEIKNLYEVKGLGSIENSEINCYVYDILYFSSEQYAIFVERSNNVWFSTPILNISIKEKRKPLFGRINFEERYPLPEGFGTIEEFLSKNILPYGFEHSKITGEIEKNDNLKNHIQENFYRTFKKEIEFIKVRRRDKYHYEFEIEMQHELFIDWLFTNYSLVSNIKITSPSNLIENIQSRITKIAENFKVEDKTEVGSYELKIYVPIINEESKNTTYQVSKFTVNGKENDAKEFALKIVEELDIPTTLKHKIKIDIKEKK